MPRTARIAPGGVIFHVLNRANARKRIFEEVRDYQPFEWLLAEEGFDRQPPKMHPEPFFPPNRK